MIVVLLRFIGKWSAVALLSLLMCEISLRVWDFYPTYSIQIKGLEPPRGDLRFILDPMRLYRMVYFPSRGINRWGYRDQEFVRERSGKKRVVVVGDSFPMGLAVDAMETFPKQLEGMLGTDWEVFNLGIQGYGPDQELDVIQSEVLLLHPDIVIWSIFPGNDFADVVKDRIFTLTSSGELVRTPENYVLSNVPQWRTALALNAIRYGTLLPPHVERDLDQAFFQDQVHILTDPEEVYRKVGVPLVSKIVRVGKDLLDQNGIVLKAVVLPSFEIIQDDSRLKREGVPPDLYVTNEGLASQALTDAQIPFANLTTAMRARREELLYVTSDRHFSVAGHGLVAAELVRLLKGNGHRPFSAF